MSLWPSKKQWGSCTLPSQLTAIGVFVGIASFLLGLFFAEYLHIRSQRASEQLAHVLMSRPVPFVTELPVIIIDGTNTQVFTSPRRSSPFTSRTPFRYLITQDLDINLRGEIRNSKGSIIAEAIGDSIRVIQAKGFDINSDTKAIEVVDSNQRPLLQLTVISVEDYVAENAMARSEQMERFKEIDEVVRLYYITWDGEIWVFSSPHGIKWIKAPDEDDWSMIPRLFCYPGYLYPGKRIDQKGE